METGLCIRVKSRGYAMKRGLLIWLSCLSYAVTMGQVVFTVDSTGDCADLSVGDGVCAGFDTGCPCTLRAAIQEANATNVPVIIKFNIPTNDPGYNPINSTFTILPATNLPPILNSIAIDGYTQVGASVNTS